MATHSKISGFTLLEISIVLVIITLITGTIIAGRSLQRSAELQAIVSDIDRFKKGTVLFKEKYKELPGDFSQATGMWGTDSSCPPAANAAPKLATCNGNGDGYIGSIGSIPESMLDNGVEEVRAWQHLANAGFIEGSYTGADYPTGNVWKPGINIPAGKSSDIGYTIAYGGNGTEAALTDAFSDINYRHIIVYGAVTGYTHSQPAMGAALTAPEAMNIDDKIDDGKPASGYVLSFKPGATSNCATDNIPINAEYNLTLEGLQCSLIFITGF